MSTENICQGWTQSCKNRGFTLIEMLIVVLIVGILTAVALPMYQRAVYKSRFSKLMLPAKTLASANEAYFLANGEYSEVPARLDVGSDTATLLDGSSILLNDDETVSFVRLSNVEVPNARYVVYQQRSANFAGTTMCESLDTDDRATWLCSKGLNGTKVDEGNSGAEAGWSAYILTGTVGANDQFAAIGSNTGGDDTGDDVGDEPTEPQTPPAPQCEGDQPADIHASGSGATGTATCVNGQWKYTWSGGTEYSTDYSSAHLVCQGNPEYKCAGSIISGSFSICEASAANGCANTIITGTKSSCFGYATNGCFGSIISGPQSFCDSIVTSGCTGVTFQAGAFCNAVVPGGCDGTLYGTNPSHTGAGASALGSCFDNNQGYCPTGVPLRGNWNESTQAYDYTWKGNCCNPAYMVSGECPAGIAVCE